MGVVQGAYRVVQAYRVGTFLKKVRVGSPAAPVVIAETATVPAVE